MSLPPAQPLSYPSPPLTSPKRSGRGKWIGWTLFVVVALVLFMLLSKQDTRYARISFTDFTNHLQAGRVAWVSINVDEATGQFTSPQWVRGGRQHLYFQAQLPHSASHDWAFTEWLTKNSNGADVRFQSSNSLIINILLPLIPWLLIFAFVWFLVLRALRKAQETRAPQLVITGPGRWVPDEPQKPGDA